MTSSNLFISCSSSVDSLGFSWYGICDLQIKEFFIFNLDDFIFSLEYIICIYRAMLTRNDKSGHPCLVPSLEYIICIYRAMLTRNDKSGHPCLVPHLRRKHSSLSSSSMMLAVGFSKLPFIWLRKFFFIPSLFRVFIVNMCWTSSSAFSALIVMIV